MTFITNFIALVLGRFSWSSPPWLKHLGHKASSRPSLFWGAVTGLILFIIISAYGYHWYKQIPRPKLITTYITIPQITPVSKTLVPDILTIDFGIQDNGFNLKSVAPLKTIGKEIPQGITLIPSMKGKWIWQNDSRLLFKPAQDWLAEQTYTIQFDKNIFTAGTKMESFSYSFTTHPFQASIAEFKFYQDPIHPQTREAVATIHFNYPVNSTSFENKTSLILQTLKKGKIDLNAQHFKYSISYDENKRIAYLHSESIPLPDVGRYLELIIDKGVKSISGTAKTAEPITSSVYIPDAGSYFKISQTSASIVRNDQDKPEQILTVETSLGIKENELQSAIHAYLLPPDYPASATEEAKTQYQWQNPGEVTADILKLSTPLNLQSIPADRDYATLHSYKFTASTPRYIYLKIDKGIQSFGDFVLKEDYAAILKVPEYPKEISFLHKGAVLALTSEKKLSVLVRGLPAVKFQIARVLPDDINQLVTQTDGKFSQPRFINDSFNQQNISEIFSEIKSFDTTDLAKVQYSALDVGKYLNSKSNVGGPKGLFLLHATGWDVAKEIELGVKTNRLILITDLGLLVKDNNNGTHDVFVQSITKGLPIEKVNVAILGKNGLPIMTRISDAKGRVNFPPLNDFTNEREPTAYIATLGSDVAFIPYNKADCQLNYSRFDIGGIVNNPESQALSAFLFSDRGLYRPGDTAHVGVIIKQAYALAQPPGLPLELIVTNPRGTTVLDKKFTLDATGYSSFDFKTDSTSLTGQYIANVFIVKDNHPGSLLGTTTLRVAEFLPDRMRISTHFSKEQLKGWISPNNLTASVGLWNLYGAPATDRKVTAKILLAPQHIQLTEYPNYIFVDPLFDPNKPPKTFSDTLSDSHTNNQGQAEFDLNLNRFDKATYQLTFFAEGFESEGGRSVTTQTTALVSPLDYFVGYKSDGDLNYIKQNTPRNVNFIAINPQLKKQSLTNLKIQLTSLHPVTTLIKNPNGTYQYQSRLQTSVLKTVPFIIDEMGTNYTLPTEQIGNFAVTILDQKNTELSRFKYTVVGASQVSLAKNAELDIKLNKSEYLPDEEIELQITAPYTGAGLITIERDQVFASQWFKTDASSSIQKIRIPKDFQGNGYVNVAFVRDWNSADIFVSPLSYSVAPFSVNHDNHDIHISLTTPKLALPGEPLTISYKSDKAGKIIIFAVDEGILQAANYKTPNPLGFFFQKHALEVITQQTLDQILPKFIQARELSAVGGDGGEEELNNNLNPFKRKTDLPVVYWSGIIDTDSTPHQLVYPVPDYFNGSLRIMAVAVATNSVGATSTTTEIRGNFVINPNLPTFVAPGDEFEITASIANNVKNSGKNAKVNIQLTASSQLDIIGITNQIANIDEGHEKTVRFKLRAKSILGSAQLTFLAKNGDKSSKMSSTLSIRPASAFLTTVTSGQSNTRKKVINLDRDMYPEYRNVEAVVSSSPLILVYGLQRYLDNFPYGCTEQLVSKAFPLLAMTNQPWFIINSREMTDKLEATVRMLKQRQMSNGGFSYWPSLGDNINNTFASVYAMHFLTEARMHGYSIPNDLFYSGINYLKELVAENPSTFEEARIQAYAIYILTRNEIVTTNYLTHLQLYLDKDPKHLWHQDITSAYMASTYLLLKSYSDADKLITYYQPQVKRENESNDFYNSNIDDAQYLYLIAKHFPDRLQQVGSKAVTTLVTAMNQGEINTLFSSYASLALSAYGQYQKTNHENLSISETLKNGKQLESPSSDAIYQKLNINLLTQQVNFNNTSNHNYFYQLTQTGFDIVVATSPIKQSLEINREYQDKNTIVNQIHLGGEIEVHIAIRALNNGYFNNIVIVDLLPGGFDVVRDSVTSQNIDYADIREDRVIFFCSVGPDTKEIVYRIKSTNIGHYKVPPIVASSMYDLKTKAQGTTGEITITP